MWQWHIHGSTRVPWFMILNSHFMKDVSFLWWATCFSLIYNVCSLSFWMNRQRGNNEIEPWCSDALFSAWDLWHTCSWGSGFKLPPACPTDAALTEDNVVCVCSHNGTVEVPSLRLFWQLCCLLDHHLHALLYSGKGGRNYRPTLHLVRADVHFSSVRRWLYRSWRYPQEKGHRRRTGHGLLVPLLLQHLRADPGGSWDWCDRLSRHGCWRSGHGAHLRHNTVVDTVDIKFWVHSSTSHSVLSVSVEAVYNPTLCSIRFISTITLPKVHQS